VLLSSPQIASTHTLELSGTVLADGKEFKAQQVMLAIVHKQTGLSATAVGKLKKGSTYSFSVTPTSIEKQIGKLVGMQAHVGCVHVSWVSDALLFPVQRRRASTQ
jgi:hypothetical protein